MSGPVKNILCIYDFNSNEIRNVVIQNVGTDPTGKTDGYIFVNSADKKLRIFLDGEVKTVVTDDIEEFNLDGTTSTSFTLDIDNTGQGVTQELYFNRGSTQGNQQLRWNESSDKFQLFEDVDVPTLQDIEVASVNGYTIQHSTHQQNTDVGTSSTTFYVNTGGPKLKNSSGTLQVRNNQDNQFASLEALDFNGIGLNESTASFTVTGGTSTLRTLTVSQDATVQHSTHQQNTDTGTTQTSFGINSDVANGEGSTLNLLAKTAGGTTVGSSLTTTNTGILEISSYTTQKVDSLDTNNNIIEFATNGTRKSYIDKDGTYVGNVTGSLSNQLSNGDGIETFSYNGSQAQTVKVNIDGSTITFDGSSPKKIQVAQQPKLSTQRTISLSGDASGSNTFDGSGDMNIVVTVADNSHNHISQNITDQTSNNTQNMIVKRGQSGEFSQGTITTQKVTGLDQPAGDSDQANKLYVDSVAQGVDVKASVRAASTQNITTLYGEQTIDGVELKDGDRVLVKNQNNPENNGIYIVVDEDDWVRSPDADTSDKVTPGMFTFVEEGTKNANSGWVLTTNQPIVLGTTHLEFEQFSGAGQITAGNGLTKDGNIISVGNGDGIQLSTDSIAVDVDGTTQILSGSSPNKKVQVAKVPNQLTGNTAAGFSTTWSFDGSQQVAPTLNFTTSGGKSGSQTTVARGDHYHEQLTFSTGLTNNGNYDGSTQRTISVTYGTSSNTAVEGTHVQTTTGIHGVGTGHIVGTTLTQELTNKTLTSPTIQTLMTLKNTTRNIVLKWVEPQTQSRDVTFGDPGANDYVAYLAATQSLSNKTLVIPTIDASGVKLRTESNALEVRNNQNNQYQAIKALTFYRSSDSKEVTYKHSQTITGNDILDEFTVNHGIGSRDVTVQVYDQASPYDEVEVGVERTDINNVKIYFAEPVADGKSYRVVVVG